MDRFEDEGSSALELCAEIVASYVSNNTLEMRSLSGLIHGVYTSVAALADSAPEPAPKAEKLKPAVPVSRSVQPDHLVCLEDGKKLTMLKRYLRSRYDLTPEQYRQRWNLPSDYPMVAPDYAKRRSAFAKEIGLGKGGRRA